MKTINCMVLIACLLCAPGAGADRRAVDETRPVDPDGKVTVKVVRGEVSIVAWDRNDVQVSGLLDEKTKEFIFSVDGDVTRIEIKLPKRLRWLSGRGSDLTIRVPGASDLDISGVSTDVSTRGSQVGVEVGTVSGDIEVSGGEGRIALVTVSGEIELRDAAGRIRLTSVSGDIEVLHTRGNATYGTVSGNVLIEDSGEEVRVESVSGDVEILNSAFTRIGGHSVSGSIDIRGTMESGGSIDFGTVSGSVRLRLSGDIDASFDIETNSGRIRNRLTDDKPRVSKYTRDEKLRFTVGDGEGEILLSTRSGDINLSRR